MATYCIWRSHLINQNLDTNQLQLKWCFSHPWHLCWQASLPSAFHQFLQERQLREELCMRFPRTTLRRRCQGNSTDSCRRSQWLTSKRLDYNSHLQQMQNKFFIIHAMHLSYQNMIARWLQISQIKTVFVFYFVPSKKHVHNSQG